MPITSQLQPTAEQCQRGYRYLLAHSPTSITALARDQDINWTMAKRIMWTLIEERRAYRIHRNLYRAVK
jgi:hypothetical protein